ncbi:PQ loop repeat-containing protein 2 [Geranomyces variabilis]|uniref:PQ loop repeat-containing protein 2 n=1 Tax=Geranomyces variabilis TaxID=109894 RepID=A0AAD5THR7_9FUNG|nr:PQ loop repeat-containing protein 2 [Geranomyces variabilis]
MDAACTCDPPVWDGHPYIPWLSYYAGECIYTPKQVVAFFCGLLALACFVVGLFPQMWKNYRRGDVSGLSLGLLLIWALGDITGFVGAVLTKQSLPVRLCAGYFLLLSAASFAQYFYYVNKNASKLALPAAHVKINDEDTLVEASAASGQEDDESAPLVRRQSTSPPTYSTLDRVVISTTLVLALAAVVSANRHNNHPPTLPLCNAAALRPTTPSAHLAGALTAWISGLMYFTSRIPQLFANHRAKSTEALSLAVFILTIVGNVSYCAGVLLRGVDVGAEFFATGLPFLVGSAGTLVFDLGILAQAWAYDSL